MGSRGGCLRDAEPLGQLYPGRYRLAGFPGARPDLALQYQRYLLIARDTGQVVKII